MSITPEFILSELPAIELFQKMGYDYYDGSQQDERNSISEIILDKRLRSSISRINPWLTKSNLFSAYNQVILQHGSSLMEINQNTWKVLRGSDVTIKQLIDGELGFHPVWYIDYQHPENNDFLIVNQMKFSGKYVNSIPDLTVFVNGIPVAIIECKSPNTSYPEESAIADLIYYQENSEKLFNYNQLCVGIYRDGGKYGAIGAPAEFYSHFRKKEDEELKALLGEDPTYQDILLYNLFRKDRLVDLIRNFVIFEQEEDRLVKKLPRYQQIRATNKAIWKLKQNDQGGVIWHTQGSGKSITMAYITRKLQAQEYGFDNPMVLVMTDRKDLDRQITGTFRRVGFKNVSQALSVVHLENLLKNDYGGIITTTLQKFQEKDKASEDTTDVTTQQEKEHELIEKSIKDGVLTKVTKVLKDNKWVELSREEITLEELSAKKNLYVLVDEAHRSHYGFIAAFMRSVLPHAKFIAFTGTPISKEDKSTLGEFYGGRYIDVYTIRESVEDGATVDLFYDEGIARIDVRKKELDEEFEREFGHEPEEKKEVLKSEALRKYQLSAERIEEICKHIIQHYNDKIRPDGHKAMIVCSGRPAAIKYMKTLEKLKNEGLHDLRSKVIISLGSPKSDDIAKEYYKTLEHNRKHPQDKRPVYITPYDEVKDSIDSFKLPFGDENIKEKSGQQKYNNDSFLIVSDMLLIGFDAPIASCLYLDKGLKEHNLLQAIARVNRSYNKDGAKKHAGYIVDYYGITDYLVQALEIFSGEVEIRPDDILIDRKKEIPKLEMNHNKLVNFFKPMGIDRNYEREKYVDKAIQYLEPLDLRDDFKLLLKQFNKSINIVLPDVAARRFEKDFKLYNEIRLRARRVYREDEGFKVSKDESLKLQQMIDDHVKSEGVENLLDDPVSIIDRDKFKKDIMDASPGTKELKIKNNLKYIIKVGLDKNPDFYKPLAERLEELIKRHRENQITQIELLKAMEDIQEEIINEQKEGESKGFYTECEIVVYNSMKAVFADESDTITRILFEQIKDDLEIIDWKGKTQVRKVMENKIVKILKVKMERSEARSKAKEMVDLIARNS